MKRKISNILILAFIFSILSFSLVVSSCTVSPDKSSVENLSSHVNKLMIASVEHSHKGVALSPIDYAGNYTAFFDKAEDAGSILTWGGDWDALTNITGVFEDYGQGYIVTLTLQAFNFNPVIIIHPSNSSDVLLNDTEKNWAVEYAAYFQPEYMGFGNEINGENMYNNSEGADEFNDFIELFNETYDAIKLVSPNTKIFTIFQLEYMKGLQGGLFGGVNDTVNLSQWSLLSNASKADFFAFTTYPCMIYKNPSDIPSDYYTNITKYTSKPIGFTEIGWFWEGFAGWESNKSEQASYIDKFFELTANINLKLAIWPFLYDQTVQIPFDKMGLLHTNETTSPAWLAWIRAGKVALISADDDDDDGDSKQTILGLNLMILIGLISIVSLIIINKEYKKLK